MRSELERLLRDVTLVALALAIALGWALFQVAEGVSTLVATFLTEAPKGVGSSTLGYSEPLTWRVDDRFVTFGPLLRGLVELAVVLLVATLLRARVAYGGGPSRSSS